ncbi:phosphotransferase [Halobacillus yeomjeoni]|uniref:phosphotransferase n=1 Tax=Halobacillus yeomjeoni TaxID=311194 RepID=UPI001CD4EE87|nr:phosphotransferase [Halobacillus yeomjeoni]MCA0982620.1 phosphotransferase [Halobacillus yeomjeoni]
MRANYREGDSYTDRLFQWLKYDEKLPILLDHKIKPRVYKVNVDGMPKILKGYTRSQILLHQIEFFKSWENAGTIAAQPLPFKENIYTKSKLGCEWGLFEWVDGRHGRFENKNDRQSAIQVLKEFHDQTKGIDVLSVPKDPLYIKWEKRLEQFSATRDVFVDYGKYRLYKELDTFMKKRLESFSRHPWGEVEEKAWEQKEWLHGDVAHHNFLIDDSGRIKLIDFDLLHRGPHLYDDIQMGQRFLPHVEHRPDDLFKGFKYVEERKIWLKGLLVPADILREWLYGYRRCLRGEGTFAYYLRRTEKSWAGRQKFVRFTENMLR